MKRIILGVAAVSTLLLFVLRPVAAVKDIDEFPSISVEKKSNFFKSVNMFSETETVVPAIEAEELYMISTQSNEYLLFVDARSEEEYRGGHISRSLSLKEFEARNPSTLPKIRVFFYSNNEDRSKQVANHYITLGVRAYYIVGGLKAWRPIQGLLPIIGDDEQK